MKLLIIRHGDPDYAHDTLTEKGRREAELLKDRLVQHPITAVYCSPLGRARATAAPTLQALGRTAEICDWLREFPGRIVDPETGTDKSCCWDLMPARINGNDALFDRKRWLDTSIYRSGDVAQVYTAVCRELDRLLQKHGYVHEGDVFRVERESTDTLVLFCHFGVECVLLSHLLPVSPVTLWQGFVALPSSVTTLYTEERARGIASFRCAGFGDLSHLYAGAEPPSFQARFCETYSNLDQRH